MCGGGSCVVGCAVLACVRLRFCFLLVRGGEWCVVLSFPVLVSVLRVGVVVCGSCAVCYTLVSLGRFVSLHPNTGKTSFLVSQPNSDTLRLFLTLKREASCL